MAAEEKYLEFLSKSGGWVSTKLFYNRTEFSDEDFFIILSKVENKIFNNFLKICFTHPLLILKNWSFYQLYIRNWLKYYRKRIKLFNLPKYFIQFFRNPIKFSRRIKHYLK